MIWFTSDTHFGHPGILTHQLKRAADFTSIKEMDDTIIDSINSVVARNDELWHMGDFGWGARKYGHYRQRLNVRRLHVLRGNHDRPSLRKHVSSMEMLLLRKFNGIKFVLCHYPIYSWPGKTYGSIHLYGHCHAMAEQSLDKMSIKRRSLDVGVDNACLLLGEWRPFSFDEIVTILDIKEPVDDELYRMWSDSTPIPGESRDTTVVDSEFTQD